MHRYQTYQVRSSPSSRSTASDDTDPPYLSGVHFKDLQEFEQHLRDKGKAIKAKAELLLSRLIAHRGELNPDMSTLEAKITALVTQQKEYLLRLDRLNGEKDQLSEQLNTATLRYFKAEKKLDRAKSSQVQKLEQQAFASATKPGNAGGDVETETRETNGNSSELLLKYEEVMAVASKQKEQIDTFLADVRTLQDENSTLKSRREALSDEDFIRCDVFKQYKSKNEDLIKRINNLEATNRQLREEAERLQAERTAYKSQLEADANQVTQEFEADIIARDQDLARVRSARDEILAENTQIKATRDQETTSLQHIQELSHAKDDRISALESEISRLKPSPDAEMSDVGDDQELPYDQLLQKYKKLDQDYRSINQELPSIEKAYKKMKDLAQNRVMDLALKEEEIQLKTAEKHKADQKYFAARKDADTRNNEIRSLRHQNSKSAEIIAQLKDLESQNRTLLGSLEKQFADIKQSNAALVAEQKKLESTSLEVGRRGENLSKQVTDLTTLLKSKDSASAIVKERNTMQEAEVEKLKVRLDHMQKDRDNWKNKAKGNSSEEEEMLRVSPSCGNHDGLLTRPIRPLLFAPFAAATSRTPC